VFRHGYSISIAFFQNRKLLQSFDFDQSIDERRKSSYLIKFRSTYLRTLEIRTYYGCQILVFTKSILMLKIRVYYSYQNLGILKLCRANYSYSKVFKMCRANYSIIKKVVEFVIAVLKKLSSFF